MKKYQEIKKFKINEKVFILYVNLTTFYISFKIEEGKFLGKVEKNISEKDMYIIEHYDDEVNYVFLEDIFKTEKQAEMALVNIINKKYEKSNKKSNKKK